MNISSMNGGMTITVDTGKLPTWPTFVAMQVAYTEAMVRLVNALRLDSPEPLTQFVYKLYFQNDVTKECRAVVYHVEDGEDAGTDAVPMTWDYAISILAIIRLKDYVATYGKSKEIVLNFSGVGEFSGKSDLDRMMVLLEERPEFWAFTLSKNFYNEIAEGEDYGKEKEDQEAEEKGIPAPGEG